MESLPLEEVTVLDLVKDMSVPSVPKTSHRPKTERNTEPQASGPESWQCLPVLHGCYIMCHMSCVSVTQRG